MNGLEAVTGLQEGPKKALPDGTRYEYDPILKRTVEVTPTGERFPVTLVDWECWFVFSGRVTVSFSKIWHFVSSSSCSRGVIRAQSWICPTNSSGCSFVDAGQVGNRHSSSSHPKPWSVGTAPGSVGTGG